jgi:hypothetical protein
MKILSVKSQSLAVALCAILLFSCRKDAVKETGESLSSSQSSSSILESPIKGKWKAASAAIETKNAAIFKTDEYYKDRFSKIDDAVEPSECAATPFDAVIDQYISEFGPLEFALFGEYAAINQLYSIIDESPQYFGANGEYTQHVRKQQRRLESFWDMPGMIRINGQHNATLDDRDKIALVYILFGGATPEEAYDIADQIIAINVESPVFIETPLLSFDGFATPSQLIVLGDGLIQALTETGVDDEIVIAGVLSHEWGHQVQFMNFEEWFGVSFNDRPQTAEFTRLMELEADFLSAYFLTHKRGGAYNWKRVAEFNELFFNIGDCAFTSSGHHGTPLQRQAATRLGYTLASETLPKGHILTADQLHQIFMQNLDELL